MPAQKVRSSKCDPLRIQINFMPQDPKVYESLSAKKSRNIVAERSYFDTHAFVSSLMENGFTLQQAEQMCNLFKEIVNFVSQDIKKDCVTKSGQVRTFILLI